FSRRNIPNGTYPIENLIDGAIGSRETTGTAIPGCSISIACPILREGSGPRISEI
ncbi:hypothetical protein M441DRAFT_91639, partial [Trichoderma asperellum CBS 433.97]